MLVLKSSLASFTASPKQVVRGAGTSISDVPQEILDLILQHLYQGCHRRLVSIVPSSRTNRQFRTSSLPLLFESLSCVVRNDGCDGRHKSFHRLAFQPHLLRYAKSLSFRKPAVVTGPCKDAEIEQNYIDDLADFEHALQYMSQLQRVRLHCSLRTAITVLRLLRNRKEVLVIVDHICRSIPIGTSQDRANFTDLLCGHTLALGKAYMPIPWLCPDVAKGAQHATDVLAIDLSTGNMLQRRQLDDYTAGIASPSLARASFHFKEVWLGQLDPIQGRVSWPNVLRIVQWSRLRRLRIDGPHLQRQFHDVTSKLQCLEDLHLDATKSSIFHANCTYNRPYVWSDVNYPFFDVDFACLPRLKTLEIIGICNHVPIRNVAAASLRALKLHKPHDRSSVMSTESQRSPSDLNTLAKIAPIIERLELDVGYVENLWHPTAIPGVDVDLEQYRFLSALSHFKSLRVFRIFPPYVAKEFIQSEHEYGFRQPLSDEQAVRIFNYIRSLCPKLELFFISASAMDTVPQRDFSPMNWEIQAWGHKTLVTTRQIGKHYELRQVWVGERRLTMETKQHAYWKKHISDPEDWLLHKPLPTY